MIEPRVRSSWWQVGGRFLAGLGVRRDAAKQGVATALTEPVPQDPAAHAFDLFVVHAAADADFVREYLLPALDLPWLRVLLSDALTPGALVVSELDRGVSRSRFTVVVLSPAYLEDRWAVLGEQLASYLSAGGVRVIPLRLADCKLPLHLEARVALDFTDRASWESEAARLRALLQTTGAPPGIAGFDDHAQVLRPPVTATPRKLELVDASFDDDEAKSPSHAVLDLKMINRSTTSSIVKRVDIHVQAIWKVPEGVARGAQEVEEVRRAPAGPDAILDPLDLVDDHQDPAIGAGSIEILEPAEALAPAFRGGRGLAVRIAAQRLEVRDDDEGAPAEVGRQVVAQRGLAHTALPALDDRQRHPRLREL
jgi:hypothetical protein